MVTTEELDLLCNVVADKRAEYEAKKEVATECWKELDVLEKQMLELLDQADKKNWETSKGKVHIAHRSSVPTPKTLEDKKLFYKYVWDNYGADVCVDKFTYNSQSLQGFYRKELENCPKDKKALFAIPGLGNPTITKILNFRGVGNDTDTEG